MDLVNLKIEKIKAILVAQKKERLLADFNNFNFTQYTDPKDVTNTFRKMIPKQESTFKNDYEKLEENLDKWVQGYKIAYPSDDPQKFKLINQLLINAQDKIELTKEKNQMDLQILMILMKARTQHPELKQVIRDWHTNVQNLEKQRASNIQSPIKPPNQQPQSGSKNSVASNKNTIPFTIQTEQRSQQKLKQTQVTQPIPSMIIQQPPQKPKNLLKGSNKQKDKQKEKIEKQKIQKLEREKIQKQRLQKQKQESRMKQKEERMKEERRQKQRREKQKIEKERQQRQRQKERQLRERQKSKQRDRQRFNRMDQQQDYLSSNNNITKVASSSSNVNPRQKILKKIERRDQVKVIRLFIEKSGIKFEDGLTSNKIALLLKENMMNHMRNLVDKLIELAQINNWNHKTSGDEFRYFSKDNQNKNLKISSSYSEKIPKMDYYRVQYPLKMKIYSELTMFQEREEQKLLIEDSRKDPLKNQKQKRNEKERQILDYVRGEGYRRTDNQQFKEEQSGLDRLKIKLVSVQYLLESDPNYVNSGLLLKTYFM